MEWNRVARITAPRCDEEVVVEWNAETLAKLGIAMEDLKKAVADSGPATASSSVNWCL